MNEVFSRKFPLYHNRDPEETQYCVTYIIAYDLIFKVLVYSGLTGIAISWAKYKRWKLAGLL